MRAHPQPSALQPPALPASRTHWDALRWPLAWGLSLITTLVTLAALAAAYHPLRPAAPRQLHAEFGPAPASIAHRDEPSVRTQPTHPQPRHVATTPSPPTATTPPSAQIATSPAPSPMEAATVTQTNSVEPHTGTATPGAISPATPLPATVAGKGSAGAAVSVPPREGQAPLSIRCPTQIKPAFPKLALEDSINHGEVRARLHLDAEGRVANVEILEARPAGYFENAVRKSALQWRCQGNGQADSIVVPFSFLAR